MRKSGLILFLAICISSMSFGQSWQQRGSDISGKANMEGIGNSMNLSWDGKMLAIGAASANSLSGIARVYEWNGSSWSQKGSDIKGASSSQDQLGWSVSLDSSGKTLAVGAPYADGSFGQFSNAGYVKVYSWSGSAWVQKGSDIAAAASGENCGYSVSLSKDGNTIAVAAAGSAGGGSGRGQTRVYTWSGSAWVQKGGNINGEEDYSVSGNSVSLDGSGNYLAIGAPMNSGSSGSGSSAGSTRVYKWSGTAWGQLGGDIDGDAASDYLGNSVSISKDGKRLIVGAPQDFNGGYGYAKIYDWSGSAWVQKGSNITSTYDSDEFGYTVSISGNGDYIATGARNGVTGNEKGRGEIYSWSGTAWSLSGSAIKGKENDDKTGHYVSLNYAGDVFAVSSANYNGSGTALGNVRVYKLTGPCTPTSSSLTKTACGSFTWNSKVYAASGTYKDTIMNAGGCDSIMTLNLTILKPELKAMASTICGGAYTSPSGKKYNNSGTYSDTLKNKAGNCDSVIYTITLTKKIPNVDGFVLKDSTITAITEGAVAHSDVDNDGDEDILISGKDAGYNLIAEIYTNDGSGNFTKMSGTNFTGAANGSASLVDMNGDNIPEVYITGFDKLNMPVAYLYQAYQGSYLHVTATPFDKLVGTKHSFADVDKDGDKDLVISAGDSVLLYKNHLGDFLAAPLVITNSKADNGFILTGDLNGDGYPDIIKSGSDMTKAVPTELFINDKTGGFTKTSAPFDNLSLSTGAIADINNDGKPDFIQTGLGSGWKMVSRTYTNDGKGVFTKGDSTSIKSFAYGSIAVEDFNSDGKQDILINGNTDFTAPATRLYLRNSLGNFVIASQLPLPALQMSAMVAFDMDKDGTKDILVTGQDPQNQAVTTLYKNKGCFAPCESESEITVKSCGPYTSPSGKYVWITSGTYTDVLEKGNAAGCDSTIIIHLTTNSFGSFSAVACDSFITPSGKVVRSSGLIKDTLKGGNEWGCDSIINIQLNLSSPAKIGSPSFTTFSASPFIGAYSSAITVGDLNGDNMPDVLVSGFNYSVGRTTRLYKNNGAGNFTEVSGTPFPGLSSTRMVIHDMDGDSKPDVLICGSDGSKSITQLYKNNGNFSFTLVNGTPFESSFGGTLNVIDMDGDNRPDVLSRSADMARLYKNNGNNNFVLVNGTPFKGSYAAVGDVDGDSKPDVLMTAYNLDIQKMTYVAVVGLYKNNGGNSFSLVSGTPFIGIDRPAIIKDMDGDNKPDVILSGYSKEGSITRVYKNSGNNNFTQISGTPFSRGSALVVDVDGDNMPDVFMKESGYKGTDATLYKNNGAYNFVQSTEASLEGLANGDMAVEDIDGDKKPDVIITGESTPNDGRTTTSRFYKNTSILYSGGCIAPTGCNTYTSPSGKYTWTKSGVYKDTLHLADHDSIITVNLLIDKLQAKFTTKTDPEGKYNALIVNKSKGGHMSFVWHFGDGDSSTESTPKHTYQNPGTYNLCLTIKTGSGCISKFCKELKFSGKKEGPYTIQVIDSIDGTMAVGIEETPVAGGANLSFNIYPNPTTHSLNVVNNGSDEFDMIVRDLSGRQVAAQQNQRGKSVVDMSALKPGMYFIEIQSDNRVGYYKVLKQ